MKYDKQFKALADDGRVFDQDALSLQEINARYFPMLKLSAVRERMRTVVDEGTWEQVWKRSKGRTVKAYRPKGK